MNRYFGSPFASLCALMLCVTTLQFSLSNELRAQAHEEQADDERATPRLGQRYGAIRNGSNVPRPIFIPDPQMNAIGWLAHNGSRFCTATIISYSSIITARHCFEESQIKNSIDLTFNVKPNNQSFPFSLVNVDINTALDIALITFDNQPFRALTDVSIIPINRAPIEGSFYDNLIGHQVTAAGYGATYEANQSGLYFAAVQIELITSRLIVVNGERRQGICPGDSGGPLLAPGLDGMVTIIAVVSKGDPCCAGIDQLTRLDPAATWIDARTGAINDTGPVRSGWPPVCAGISQLGTCSGNMLRQCAITEVRESDCGVQRCDYDRLAAQVSCIAPCQDVPSQGRCVGNELHRCERGEVVKVICDSACQTIEDGDTFACVNLNPLPNLDNEYIPICIANEDNLIREASEARFVGTPSCQQEPAQVSWLWLLLSLIMWRQRRALTYPS